MTPQKGTPRPLARELLWYLALLVGAALSLAVLTTLVAQILQPGPAALALVAMIGGDLAILFLFGRHLIRRLVLRPVRDLAETADALSRGDLSRRAPGAETAEFTHLAERLNGMTDALLDVQGQLVQAEKLAGVGRLAAGVAHEVGNPLAAIRNYVDVLRRRGEAQDVTDALVVEADRIDRIVRSLLDYARPDDQTEGVVEVGQTVEGVLALLENQGALRGREVRLHVGSDLPSVRGRANALEQVVVNLLLNALDAAAAGPIVVAVDAWRDDPRLPRPARRTDPTGTSHHRPATSRRPWRAELDAGSGVTLVVADSGPGVPEDERDRVFDPFFTTKDPGEGTGLGLAIVQRTVHDMGGVIWVETAREGGAAFKVVLPAT